MQIQIEKWVKNIFFWLVILSLLAPLWVFRDLLFPYVTSKAFYFRILIETAFPFYLYLIISRADLRPKLKNNPLNILMLTFLLANFVSAFTGVGMVRSLWGNFERMGGAYYLSHLTALYFYILCFGQMNEKDMKQMFSLRWNFFAGGVCGFIFALIIGFRLNNWLEISNVLKLIVGFSIYIGWVRFLAGSFLEKFLKAFLIGALVVTVNGIFGKMGLPTLIMDPSLPTRVSSTLGNPIYVGSFLVIPFFLALFLGRQASDYVKAAFYYFTAFLFFVGIILSGTRGSFVGIFAGMFLGATVYLILNPSKKIRIYGGIASLLVSLVFILLVIFHQKLPQGSFQRLFNLGGSNTEARLIQWKIALKGYKDFPVFGVGPENYYYISNKYYDPEIFQYDRSWFDKPHNYLLEILVTTGIVGFSMYLGILGLLGWGLFKGYRNGLLSLSEFCILLSALLVYQIQNLSVFDTVPASLSFYSFMGLAGYIYFISKNSQVKINQSQTFIFPQSLPAAASVLSMAVVAYLVYATNIIPMKISSLVNHAFANAGLYPEKANEMFKQAVSLPFNFDKTQTAQKYSEFSGGFARRAATDQLELKNEIIEGNIKALQNALVEEPKYPILWNYLAEAYLFRNFNNGQLTKLDPNVILSINEAISLAPDRGEAYLSLAQYKAADGDIAGAEKILISLSQKFPKDQNSRIQLATLNRIKQNYDEAVKFTLEAQELGYVFPDYASMKWMVMYYVEKGDLQKAFSLQEQAQKIEPNNIMVYEDLAKLYATAGRLDLAKNLATNIIANFPESKPRMQLLLDTIAQKATSTVK